MELAEEAGPPEAPGGRRVSLLGLLPPPRPLRDRGFPSMVFPNYSKMAADVVESADASTEGHRGQRRQTGADNGGYLAMKWGARFAKLWGRRSKPGASRERAEQVGRVQDWSKQRECTGRGGN